MAKTDRAAGPGAKDRSEAPRDAVELTDTATNLQRIEARLTDVSDVDPQRVDAMRRRIESGDYRVDHEKLAQKLLKLEQDLT